MEIIAENLGHTNSVLENEPLPIKYIEEIIESAVLSGRMMGLMAKISKRTDNPITYEDEILKKDNMMLHAFLRVAQVITKEEQRVFNALIDESKWLQENLKSESSDGMMWSLLFVQGWKFEANEIFAKGGNMYDLLVFTDRKFLTNATNKTLVNGYRGELPNANLHIFSDNGQKGLKDKEDNIVIEAKYDDIHSSGWTGRGWLLCKDGKWGYIDGEGNELLPIEYDYISLCSGGNMIRVEKDNLYGYYNMEDNSKVEIQFEQAHDFYSSHSDEAEVKINGHWGVIDRKGNYVLTAEYDSVNIESPNVYRVEKDGLEGMINKDKEILFPFKYRSLSSFNKEGIAVVQNSAGLYGYIDKEDNLFIGFQFKCARNFKGNYAEVTQGYGKTGVIDKTGKIVVPLEYDSVCICWDDIIEVHRVDCYNSRFLVGLYDIKTGNMLPCIYKQISPMGRDRDGIMVCRCKKYGMLEKIEERVVSNNARGRVRTNDRRTFCITYRENQKKDGIQVSIIDVFDRVNLFNDIHPGLITEVEVKNSVLNIPERINGHPVIEIESCRTDKSNLKCVIFPRGLQRIGKGAFMAHPTLETVIIQDGIVTIGDFAFANCPSLKNVILGVACLLFIMPCTPLTFNRIHEHAFNRCSPDLTFYIPRGCIGQGCDDRERFRHVLPREDYESAIVEQYMSSVNESDIAPTES